MPAEPPPLLMIRDLERPGWSWRIEHGEVTIWSWGRSELPERGDGITPEITAYLRCSPGQELDVLRRLLIWAARADADEL